MAQSISLGSILLEVVADSRGLNRGLNESTSIITRFANNTRKQFRSIGTIAAVGLAAIGVGLGAAIKTAIVAEEQFADVKKTISTMTPEEFEDLNKEILKLSSSQEKFTSALPGAYEQLTDIATIIGQMGFTGVEMVAEMTEAVGLLTMTTVLGGEEAATYLGRFMSIMGSSQEDAMKIASSVVELGNNMAATEKEIMDNAIRLAGAGKVIGMTEAEVLGLGATIAALGIKSRAGTTAVSRSFMEMEKAVLGMNATSAEAVAADHKVSLSKQKLANDIAQLNRAIALNEQKLARDTDELMAQRQMYDALDPKLRKQEESHASLSNQLQTQYERLGELGEQWNILYTGMEGGEGTLETFAKVSGKTTRQFAKDWKENAAGALTDFLKGLGEFVDNEEDVFTILENVGLGGSRARETFLKLAQGIGAANEAGGLLATEGVRMAIEAFVGPDGFNDAGERASAIMREAEERFKTTISQLNSLKNYFRAAGIIIGNMFLPAFKEVLQHFRNFVERVMPPVIEAIQKAADWFESLSPQMRIVATAILGIGAAMGFLLAASAVMHPLFYRLRRVVMLVTPQIGLLVAGIGLLTAAWTKNWGGIQDKILPLYNSLVTEFGKVASTLGGLVGTFVTAIKGGDWAAAIEAMREVISTIFVTATRVLTDDPTITDAEGAKKAFAAWAWNWYIYIRDTWRPAAIEQLKNVLVDVYVGASALLLNNPAITDPAQAEAAWGTWWGNVWSTITTALGAVGQALGEKISAAWKDALEWWATTGKPTAVEWGTAIAGWWASAYEFLLGDYRVAVVGWFEENKEGIVDAIGAGLAIVAVALGTATAIVEPLLEGLLTVIGAAMDRLTEELPGIDEALIKWLETGEEPDWGTLGSSVALLKPVWNLFLAIGDLIENNIVPLAGTLGMTIFDVLVAAVEKAWELLDEWAGAELADMESGDGGAFGAEDLGRDMGDKFTQGLLDGIVTAIEEWQGDDPVIIAAFKKLAANWWQWKKDTYKELFFDDLVPSEWLDDEGDLEGLKEIGKRIYHAIGDGLADAAAAAEHWLALIAEKIKKGWAEAKPKFTELGAKVWGGIKEGLVDALQSFSTLGLVLMLLKKLTGAAEAESPAKRFIPLGASIGAGVIQGLEQAMEGFDGEGVMSALAFDMGGGTGGGGTPWTPVPWSIPDSPWQPDWSIPDIVDDIEDAVDDIVEAIDKGATQVAKHAPTIIDAIITPPMEGWTGMMADLIALTEAFLWDAINLSRSIGSDLLEDAQTWASAASAYASAISAVVDAVMKLEEFEGIGPNVRRNWASLREFFNEIFRSWGGPQVGEGFTSAPDEKVSQSVSTYASAISSIASAMSTAVDAVTAIGSMEAITDFGDRALQLAGYITDILTAFEGIGGQAFAGLAGFSEAVSGTIGMVASAVGAVEVLDDMGAVSGIEAKAKDLAGYIITMAQAIADVADWSASKKKWEEAGKFATAMGPILSALSSALATVEKLVEFEVAGDLANKVKDLVDNMLIMANELASVVIDDEDLKRANEFATKMGAIINVIGSGVTALAALGDWVVGDRIADEAHALAFRLLTVARQLRLASLSITDEEMAAAVAFADNIARVIAPIKTGIEAVSDLADWTAVPSVLIKAHILGVRLRSIVWMLGEATLGIDAETQEAAAAFADDIARVIAPIKASIEAIDELVKWEAPASILGQAKILAVRLHTIIAMLATEALKIPKKTMADALEFAAAIGTIAEAITKGLTLLTEMRAWKIVKDITEQMDAFVKSWKYIIDEFVGLKKDIDELLDETVTKFAAALGEIADALKKGLDLLAAIGDFVAPSEQAVGNFMEAIAGLFMSFYNWIAGHGDWEGQGANLEEGVLLIVEKFGSALGALMDGLSSAIGFTLEDWTPPFKVTGELWAKFSGWVTGIFTSFYEWLETEEWTEEQVRLVGAFASALESLLGALTLAVEFTLEGWEQPFELTGELWAKFFGWVTGIFTAFYEWLEGEEWTEEQVRLVGVFASALESLLEALTAAAEYTFDEGWEGTDLSEAGVWYSFFKWVRLLFKTFYVWLEGAGWDAEQIGIVSAFADALTGLLDALTLAAQYTLAEDWKPVDLGPDSLWAKFFDWVTDLFDKVLGYIDETFGTDDEDADPFGLVSAWAGALSAVVGGLQAAAEFALADDWAPPDKAVWDPFFKWVGEMFAEVYEWVTTPYTTDDGQVVFTLDGLALVNAWGGALGSIMSGLGSAVGLAADVANFVSPGTGPDSVWGEFVGWAEKVFEDLYDYIILTYPQTEEEAEDFAPVSAWGQALSAIMGGLGSALTFFEDLPGFVEPMDGIFDDFKGAVTTVFSKFLAWVRGEEEGQEGVGISEAGMESTKLLGEAFKGLFDGLTSAVGFLAGVGTLFHPSEAKLIFFMGQVKLTFTTMEQYAAGFTQSQRDIVSDFGTAMSDLIGGLTAALVFISKLEDTPIPELGGEHMDSYFEKKLSNFIDAIDAVVFHVSTWVTQKFNPEAALIITNFTGVMEGFIGGLTDALNLLILIEESDLPSMDTLDAYLALVQRLFEEFVEGIEETPADVTAAAAGVLLALGQAAKDIENDDSSKWYDLGASTMWNLANGMEGNMWRVTEKYAELRGLNPESPAEWGPFKDLPDASWVDSYMADTASRFDLGLAGLNSLPSFTPPSIAAGAGGINITVNMKGATIRNDDDARLVGQALFDQIRASAGVW